MVQNGQERCAGRAPGGGAGCREDRGIPGSRPLFSYLIPAFGSLIPMDLRSFLLLSITVLLFIIFPAVQAAEPAWIVPASPGIDLSGVAISRDGSTVVAGGDQLIVISGSGEKLWSGCSGNLLDLSRDGRYIVTTQGRTVRLFDRQGTNLWDRAARDTITAISITPDATVIAAGGGTTVQSWYNSGSGIGINTTETVRDLRISPEKDQIIVATDKALRSFNLSFVPNWYDDTISPGSFAISFDGTGIVIPNGNHVRMYHGSGTLLWDRSFPGGNILALAYADDGSVIVCGRDDGTVLAIDRDGALLFSRKAGTWVTSVGVSADGSTIATGDIDNQIRMYDRDGLLLGSYGARNPVKSRSIAVSRDGSLIVAVDQSNVYGFFRSRLTPVTPTETSPVFINVTTSIPRVTTVPGDVTSKNPITTIPSPMVPPTQAAGFSWLFCPATLALVVMVKKR